MKGYSVHLVSDRSNSVSGGRIKQVDFKFEILNRADSIGKYCPCY